MNSRLGHTHTQSFSIKLEHHWPSTLARTKKEEREKNKKIKK